MKKAKSVKTSPLKPGPAEKDYLRLFEKLRKSEKEKSVILDAMTELVLFLDRDMKVIWANKAMCDAFNLTPGELNGKHCYKALHNRDRVCRVCPAEKSFATGLPQEVVEISSYRKNWVLRSYPVRDEKGELIGIVEIVTDVTERHRAEEAMRQSEQKYRELFENASDMIFVMDFAGNILSCNEAASKTYGYAPGRMIGVNIKDLLDVQYIPVARDLLKTIFDGLRDPSPREFLTYTKNGETVWLEINARTMRENGKQVSIHGIARNITERKRMEEDLRKRERELEEKSRNLEEANMALKVLLKHREEDRVELEEKVLYNMRELIIPYIENLKMTNVDSRQLNQLKIIEDNIKNIISPFMRNLSTRYPNLTPTEIQVINFIKEGRTTKEIAGLLKASSRTIEFHRDNIRKKLRLKNRKMNLRSHLLTLQ